MQVGTGKSILNGIAIGKLKIYKKKDTVISAAEVADNAAEVARFEDARAKAIDQQTALYEKALAEAGEDIAEVFNIHAMMLDDDDFVDAIKEIINGQHKCAEYAVKTAGDNQAAVFAAMDDPYLQARSADVIDIAQAILDILQGVDNASLQGTEPSILVAEDLAPSETVRMDKSLLLGFITREGSSNSHTAILARSMNIPALIQCKDIQDDWDGKMAVVDGYNACVYVDPTPDLLKSLKKRQQEDQKKQALLQELKGKPNTTLDGKTINVFANIGGMGDVGAVQQNDAGGVGLFRTEFLTTSGALVVLLLLGLSAIGSLPIFFFVMLYGTGAGMLSFQLLADLNWKALAAYCIASGVPTALAAGCLCLFGASALQVSGKIQRCSFGKAFHSTGAWGLVGQFAQTLFLLLPICGAATGMLYLCGQMKLSF